jgi:hypothetical protein
MTLVDRPRIYGVDFSGAANAGAKIWIASGAIEGRTLRMEECIRAEALPGSGRDRGRCLAALRDAIGNQREAAWGLDFPFGLPADLVEDETWEEFLRQFPARYAGAHAFRQACRKAANGREVRRVTDREMRTPFSPYNLRLYRQTYHGIRDVLAPLVATGSACVLPMQPAQPARAWVLEVCPASLLKREDLYVPYKGRTAAHRANRQRIFKRVKGMEGVAAMASGVREAALEDPGGDALDGVLAALATFRSLREPARLMAADRAPYALEGYVCL